MLIKLLKFDIKVIGRTLFPQYLCIILISAFLGFYSVTLNSYKNNMILQSGMTLFVILSVTIGISTLYTLGKRWVSITYENEAYLIQSLPISTSDIVVEKIILSFIFGLLGELVLFFSVAMIASTASISSSHFSMLIKSIWEIPLEVIRQGMLVSLDVIMVIVGLILQVAFVNIFCASVYKRNNWIVGILFAVLLIVEFMLNNYVFITSSLELEIVRNIAYIAVYALATWYFLEYKYNM